MPETVVVSDGQILLRGLTNHAAEQSRLAIASDIERLGPEGSAAIAEALREPGPEVTIERLDAPFVARAWLGREWCAWALPEAGDPALDEAAVRFTPAGQIGAIIARIVGLGPGPERGTDDEPLLLDDEDLAAWCADAGVSRWRIRIAANTETGDSASFEAVHHPSLGWFVAVHEQGTDGSAYSLSPTSARMLWQLLFSQLVRALPTGG